MAGVFRNDFEAGSGGLVMKPIDLRTLKSSLGMKSSSLGALVTSLYGGRGDVEILGTDFGTKGISLETLRTSLGAKRSGLGAPGTSLEIERMDLGEEVCAADSSGPPTKRQRIGAWLGGDGAITRDVAL